MTSVDKLLPPIGYGTASRNTKLSTAISDIPASAGSSNAATADGTSAREVTISGRGMLMSRLFEQDESTYTGAVATTKMISQAD